MSRNARLALLLPAALVAYLGSLSLVQRVAMLRAEDGVTWIMKQGSLEAARVEAEGPADLGGLRVGDRLVLVEGEAPAEGRGVGQLLSGREGRPTRYQILRAGDSIGIEVVPRPSGEENRLYYYLFIAGIAALGAGSLAFLKLPSEPAATALYGVCLTFSALLVLTPEGASGGLNWVFYWGDLGGRLFLPPFLLGFIRRLMREDEGLFHASPRVAWLLVPAFALLALAVYLIPFEGALDFSKPARAIRIKDRLEVAYMALSMGAAAIFLCQGLWRSTRARTRWRLTSAAASAVAGLLPVAFLYLLPLALGIPPGQLGELAVLPLVLVPLGFTATLFQERTVDLDRSLRAMVRWSTAGGIFLGGGALGSYLLSRLAGGRLAPGILTEVLLPLAASLGLAAWLYRPLARWIDRRMGSRPAEPIRLMLEFSKDLSGEIRMAPLARRLTSGLEAGFGLSPALLLVDGAGTGEYESVASEEDHRQESEERPRWRIPEPARRGLARKEVLLLEAGTECLPPEISASLCQLGYRYLFPMVTGGHAGALLVVGPHRDGSPLSGEEVDALAALAAQAARGVEAARLYREIEERSEREAALRRETEAILESSRIGILLADAHGTITAANRAASDILGVDSPVGQTVSRLLPRGLLMLLDRSGREGTAAGERVFRFSFGAADGITRVVNATRSVLGRHPNGGKVYTLDEVTEQLRREERMAQQDHLASMGLLASQVAHEVNAPLTGIASYAQILMARLKSRLPEMELLRKIESQAFRAAGITGSVLNFARRKERESDRLFDPGPVVAESLALFEPHLKGKRIRMTVERAPSLPAIRGHRGKLQQVVINLLLNAAQALPSGGEIRLSVDRDGESVRLRVSDNGVGIPSADLSRIFEPFFTARAGGGGTGLGLSVVQEIVRDHGGAIQVESVEGAGSTFTVSLPAAVSPATLEEVAPVA